MSRTPRQEVWLAMSDLFLDTDVSLHHDHIVRRLLASPFDLATLDQIFICEVFPACISNLHDVAGEWAGFSEKPLLQRVARREGRQPLLGAFTLRRRWRRARDMVPEWFKVRRALEAAGKE